ncbi:MAG: hypothetical protein IT276_12050 [Ignavibacteriaceae bacterium]|jgi:hypothetical protein|nr:hypothetical protein [Ignavibacterium sp.]MCC6255639.1 hypothetical protein [Ignavibacteriaceae bacterium]HMN24556.1 hypothetical protein [Ignavibacteriaceae bacterium]HRN25242.1 hypothetical protein [Ignavibacteriaceae bacterium]HRP93676.1 hypothetical protein [Ignavibacteriaceae bacterium]
MSKTYIGQDGHYDIDDDGKVIQKMVNEFGRLTGITKVYSNFKRIPNLIDRNKIEYFLQMLKIYKVSGRV